MSGCCFRRCAPSEAASRAGRYFTKEDVEKEIKMQQGEGNANIEVHVLESTWGHRAGDPWRKGQQQQNIWLTKKVHELMRKGVSARV